MCNLVYYSFRISVDGCLSKYSEFGLNRGISALVLPEPLASEVWGLFRLNYTPETRGMAGHVR